MCKKTHLLYLIACAILLTSPAYAELYRCTNAAGKLSFQDYPCQSGAKQQTFEVPNSGNSISSNIVSVNNLVKNHGFEEGLKHWLIQDIKANKEGINHRANIENYSSAVLELAAVRPPDNKFIYTTKIEQCIPLGRGAVFTLGASARLKKAISQAYANRVNIIWYETIDCSAGGQFGDYIDVKKQTTGWQQLEKRNLKPFAGAIAAKIEITQNGRKSDGVPVFWDNISLAIQQRGPALERRIAAGKTLASGKNYLKNSSFANNLSAWDLGNWINGWANDYQHRGSLKVSSSSTSSSIGKSAFSQCVNFGANRRFDMGIRFKQDNSNTQSGGGRLRATWYPVANCTGNGKTKYDVDPKPVAGWQNLTVKGMVAPVGSVSVKFTVIQSISGAGRFSAYWDDAYFRRSY